MLAFTFEDFLVVLHERDLRLHAGEMLVSRVEIVCFGDGGGTV